MRQSLFNHASGFRGMPMLFLQLRLRCGSKEPVIGGSPLSRRWACVASAVAGFSDVAAHQWRMRVLAVSSSARSSSSQLERRRVVASRWQPASYRPVRSTGSTCSFPRARSAGSKGQSGRGAGSHQRDGAGCIVLMARLPFCVCTMRAARAVLLFCVVAVAPILRLGYFAMLDCDGYRVESDRRRCSCFCFDPIAACRPQAFITNLLQSGGNETIGRLARFSVRRAA